MPKFIKLTNSECTYFINIDDIRTINIRNMDISWRDVSIYFKDNKQHNYVCNETPTQIMEMINA